MIKVSVIMPCLNVVAYIKKCIESVIGQTMFEDLELILIDAGSIDGTQEILSYYSAKYSNFSIIHSDRKSYGYQINQGIKAAKGEYIAILETDDYVACDMYKLLYDKAITNDLDYIKANHICFAVVSNTFEVVLDNSMDWKTEYDTNIMVNPSECPASFAGDNYIWNGIYKKKFLMKNRIYLNESQGAAYQDIGFSQLIHNYAKRAMYISNPLYRYQKGRDGSSVNSGKGLIFAYQEFDRLLSMKKDKIDLIGLYRHMFLSFIGEFYLIEDISVFEPASPVYKAMDWIMKQLELAFLQGILDKDLFELEEMEIYDRIREDKSRIALDNILERSELICNLIDIRAHSDRLIIFGAGHMGRKILVLTDKYKIKTDLFFDNKAKEHNIIGGVPVVKPSPEYLTDKTKIIIANKKNVHEIIIQLKEIGVSTKDIYRYSGKF